MVAETKCSPFCRQHIEICSLLWRVLHFHWISYIRVQLTISQYYLRYGADRRQAIIWTNDVLLYRCINASLVLGGSRRREKLQPGVIIFWKYHYISMCASNTKRDIILVTSLLVYFSSIPCSSWRKSSGNFGERIRASWLHQWRGICCTFWNTSARVCHTLFWF